MVYIAIIPKNNSLFVIVSYESTDKLWEICSGKCVHTHEVHESDIESAFFFQYVNSFETVSYESTFCMFSIILY